MRWCVGSVLITTLCVAPAITLVGETLELGFSGPKRQCAEGTPGAPAGIFSGDRFSVAMSIDLDDTCDGARDEMIDFQQECVEEGRSRLILCNQESAPRVVIGDWVFEGQSIYVSGHEPSARRDADTFSIGFGAESGS